MFNDIFWWTFLKYIANISLQYIGWEILDYQYEINKFDRLKNFLHFVILLIIIIPYIMINSFSFEIEKKYLIMNIRSFKDFLKYLKLFDIY